MGDDDVIVARFDLSASYIGAESYAVTGTVSFEGNEPVSISGLVYGFRTNYLRPQTSVLPAKETLLADIGGAKPLQLCVSSSGTRGTDTPVVYTGVLAPPASFEQSDDSPYCSEVPASRVLTLEKP